MNPDPLEVLKDGVRRQIRAYHVTRQTYDGPGKTRGRRMHSGDGAAATSILAIIAQHYEPLLAEVERLREDAARYRWLRDESCPPHNFYVSVPDEFKGVRYSAHEVDTYIDAARQALGEKS